MAEKKFTWVSTHKSIVQYLLKNEKNQQKIIDLLKSVGITRFDDESKPGKKVPLTEIDPFTFFCFIYKYKKQRLNLLQEIAKKLSLPVPEDDLGIPSAQALKVWLFPFKYGRNNNEVERLWTFFKKALKNNITNKDFDDILTIQGTGKAKLTEGLFNIDPERFLPINGPMKPFLKNELKVEPEFNTWDEYLSILDQITKKSKKTFYELSADAYIWNSQKEPVTIVNKPNNDNSIKYWLYSPGSQAKYWQEFYSNGIMGLGQDELGDFLQYKTKADFTKKFQEIEKTNGSKINDSAASFDFLYTMSVGDIVIVKKGKTEYLGYGIVTSDYIYDTKRSYYQHIRKVDWKSNGIWKDNNQAPVKTLTDITKSPDHIKKLVTLLNIIPEQKQKIGYPLNVIFYGPPGTGKTYNTIIRAAEIVSGEKGLKFDEALKIYNNNLHDTIEFITFHQNYSYEDFIQGLRPDLDQKGLAFERRDGIFKVIADRALKNLNESSAKVPLKQDFYAVFEEIFKPYYEEGKMEINMKKSSFNITNVTDKYIDFDKSMGTSHHTLNINSLKKMYENGKNDNIIGGLAPYYQPILEKLLAKGNQIKKESVKRKNYVLIIDEINRANISRVFGELITLIECDKRSGGKIPMNAKLPSGESFCVPANLYIIGTMNTADKSIALLDIALRRRFEFEAEYPDYELKGMKDVEILRKINEQIITMKGYDFQIGHSFFMGDDYDLIKAMNLKVIPLLLEYFMNKEDEVKKILIGAGLKISDKVWPIQIKGVA